MLLFHTETVQEILTCNEILIEIFEYSTFCLQFAHRFIHL